MAKLKKIHCVSLPGRRLRWLLFLPLLCVLLSPWSADARPKPREKRAGSAWDVDLSGSYKAIGELQQLRQSNIFASNTVPLTEQRLRLQGILTKDWFRVEVANETSLFYQKANPAAFPFPDYNPLSAWNAQSNLVSNNNLLITNRIDRAYVQLNWAPIELRVGKQVISEGVGHIFNAISQVPRYAFIVVDPEYPKTEDAASFIWDGPLVLEARFLPRVPGQQDHNFHLRAKGSKDGYDIALTAGRSDDKSYLGLEAAGNVGESLLRSELVGYNFRGVDYLQALVGYDTVFNAEWSAQFEVFYNGFGQKAGTYTLTQPLHRPAPYRGRWYAAGTVTWETTARLKSNFLAIVNLLDPSTLLHLYFTFSLWENIDLMAGQFLNVGGASSEFGGKLSLPVFPAIQYGIPDLTYAALKFYF